MVRLRLMVALLLATTGCGQTGVLRPSLVAEPTTTRTPFLPAGFVGLPTFEARATEPGGSVDVPMPTSVDIAEVTESLTGPGELVDLADIIETMNRIREREGVPDLASSPDLARIAQARSEELSLTRSLWHVDASSGMTPGDRMAQTGFSGALAEHVIAVTLEAEDPVGTVLQAWLTDSSHRRDVLDPQFSMTGLGLSEDGRWRYLVQLLAENGPGT